MPPNDQRGDRLRTFDACAEDLTRHLAERFEGGAGAASRDVFRLSALAERLTEAIHSWRTALGSLEAVAAEAIDPQIASRRLLESVFDDLLIPEAARVLASALDLTWTGE